MFEKLKSILGFRNNKEEPKKEQGLQIGDRYRKDKDPFSYDIFTILDIKEGYIKYRHDYKSMTNGENLFYIASQKIETFKSWYPYKVNKGRLS